MRSRWRVYATVIAVTTLVFCLGAVTGRAGNGDDEDARIMLFSGRDLWRHGGFVHGGVVVAPSGFDHDGLLSETSVLERALLVQSERPGRSQCHGRRSVIPGIAGLADQARQRRIQGFLRTRISAALSLPRRYIEPAARHLNRPADRGRTLARADAGDDDCGRCLAVVDCNRKFGARGLRLAHSQRSDGRNLCRSGTAILRLPRLPELRVGAHITSMKAEDTEWSAATGWAWDSQSRASPYVRINVLKRL